MMSKLQQVPMDPTIRELVRRARGHFGVHNLMSNPVQHRESIELWDERIVEFARLIVEETLKQVDERTYGRGENQWYYNEDKEWVRLHFGYGKLQATKEGK
jgi:hypothetical protein